MIDSNASTMPEPQLIFQSSQASPVYIPSCFNRSNHFVGEKNISMASVSPLQTLFPGNSLKQPSLPSFYARPAPVGSTVSWEKKKRSLTVVAAVGDVSAEGTTYLIAGAVAVALVGTAFPIFFSRKDLCPVCDGAGFVRQSGAALRANAARKDQAQIVCPRCNGLGKLNQVDK